MISKIISKTPLLIILFISGFVLVFNIVILREIRKNTSASTEYEDKYPPQNIPQEAIDSFYKQVIDVKQLLNDIPSLKKDVNISDFAYHIVYEANIRKIDPYIILAMIKTESGFRTNAISDAGAIGLMQIMPDTGTFIDQMENGRLQLGKKKDLYDPMKNVMAGIFYYSHLYETYKNNKHALIAYNMGPGNLNKILAKNGSPPVKYYLDVMENYRKIAEKSSFLNR